MKTKEIALIIVSVLAGLVLVGAIVLNRTSGPTKSVQDANAEVDKIMEKYK